MRGIANGFVGAVAEAWSELRVHRTRVLLSLIGVAVAVAAITAVTAFGQIAEQAQREQLERSSGRPATLYANAYSVDGAPVSPADTNAAFSSVVDRYKIGYAGRTTYTGGAVQFVDGVIPANGQIVDVNYGTMHRVELVEGRWFTAADENRLAPAIIVNQFWWEKLGSPDLRTHPEVRFVGDGTSSQSYSAVIIGVVPSPEWDQSIAYTELYSAYERTTPPATQAQQSVNYEFWVPPALAEELTARIQRDMSGALGTSVDVQVSRQDYLSFGGEDPFGTIKIVLAVIGGIVLLLGALGLVNISLVTVRQRIREIGIRRTFGATAGRVFFAVMMESIVATTAAGVVGVIVAVIGLQLPFVRDTISQGVSDLPPFPVGAALLGIGCAVGVGALAGLLPALVAVRVKVIDAIRY
jgi:putative ABC transport system permease protein